MRHLVIHRPLRKIVRVMQTAGTWHARVGYWLVEVRRYRFNVLYTIQTGSREECKRAARRWEE